MAFIEDTRFHGNESCRFSKKSFPWIIHLILLSTMRKQFMNRAIFLKVILWFFFLLDCMTILMGQLWSEIWHFPISLMIVICREKDTPIDLWSRTRSILLFPKSSKKCQETRHHSCMNDCWLIGFQTWFRSW